MSETASTRQAGRAHTLLLILILLAGFALRLSQPTLVEFKRDEATIARLGQAIAYEGYLPAVGVDSSLGIDNLPLTLYLVALPLRLWPDPLAAVLFTCLLNSLALVGCYVLGRVSFGKSEALLATWLFAVSPWAVLYARKIWSRTLPVFTLAFVISCVLTFAFRRRWALVPAFAGLAGLLGLQLEALAFVPVLVLALLLYRDSVDWRALVVGVAVFGLLMLPYGIHDARNGWANARGLLGYARGDSTFSWDAVCYALSLLGGEGIEGQAGPFHLQFREALGPFWWLNHVLSLLLAPALIYACHQALWGRDQARRRIFLLLLLWFAVPILLQLAPSAPAQRHYFVMHYPVQYLLIAAFSTEWGRRLSGAIRRRLSQTVFPASPRVRRFVVGGTLALLAAYGAWQAAVTAELRRYMVMHPTTGGYGVPLRYTRQAAQAARALAPAGEIVVLSETTQPFLTETPTVFDALLFGVPHRFADGRSSLPVPQAATLAYLVGPVACSNFAGAVDPLEVGIARLQEGALIEGGQAVALPGGVAYQTYAWRMATRDGVLAGMTPLAQGIPFANNVVFAAFEAPDAVGAGDNIVIWLAWWLRAGAPEGADYHFTMQLLDQGGAMVAQDDHAGYPSAMWRAEDLVLSRFVVAVPADAAGPHRLRAGMYTYPEILPVAVVDPAGNPIDDGVTLIEALPVE